MGILRLIRLSLVVWLLLSASVLWAEEGRAGDCLSPADTQSWFVWLQALSAQADFDGLGEPGLVVSPDHAEAYFGPGRKAPALSIYPRRSGDTCDLVGKHSCIRFGELSPRYRAVFRAAVALTPPPDAWSVCGQPDEVNARIFKTLEPQKWFCVSFVGHGVLLIWLVLALWRWRREQVTLRWEPSMRWLMVAATALMLALQVISLTGFQHFNMDSGRNLTAGLLWLHGIECPFRGPEIFSGSVHVGPLYYILTGLVALVDDAPQLFFLVPALAQLVTLWLGMAFMRRAFGFVGAAAFALLWGGSAFLITHLTIYTHDYLTFPLWILVVWVTHDMVKRGDGRLFPLAVLLTALGLELYSIYALVLVSLPLIVWLGRVRPGLKSWFLAGLAFLLAHIYTPVILFIDGWQGTDAPFSIGRPVFGVPFSQFLRGMQVAMAGLAGQPLWLSTPLVLVALAAAAYFVVKPRPFDPPARRQARMILWVFFLPIVIVTASLWFVFVDRYHVVMLPFAQLLIAGGAADLLRGRKNGEAASREMGWVALLVFVIMALLVVRAEQADLRMLPSAFSLHDQQALATVLKRQGVVTPMDFRRRVHAVALQTEDCGFAGLLLVDPARSDPDADPARQFWLTEEPLPALAPDATLYPTASTDRPYRLVGYESRLALDQMTVAAGPDMSERVPFYKVFQPWGILNQSRSILMLHGLEWGTSDFKVRELAELATRIRVEIPLRAPLDRPLRVITSKGCTLRLFAGGRSIEGESGWPGLTGTHQPRISSYPPVGAVERLIFEIDTQGCNLDVFDVFDLPVGPDFEVGEEGEAESAGGLFNGQPRK